jgi:hypothetical protein
MRIGHAALTFSPGDVGRFSDRGKFRILAIPTPNTVHYQLIPPWWFRLWRWASK